MILTKTDRAIISALSRDLPETLAPFKQISADVGVSEEELLSRAGEFQRCGLLRRFGATVDQKKLGFVANAMVVWKVPDERVREVARAIVSCPNVSHCYERETRSEWPYNLYAMLHAETLQQCAGIAAEIASRMGIPVYKLLLTVREFKKARPDYFGARSWEARGE